MADDTARRNHPRLCCFLCEDLYALTLQGDRVVVLEIKDGEAEVIAWSSLAEESIFPRSMWVADSSYSLFFGDGSNIVSFDWNDRTFDVFEVPNPVGGDAVLSNDRLVALDAGPNQGWVFVVPTPPGPG